jgi:hypothetical protein
VCVGCWCLATVGLWWTSGERPQTGSAPGAGLFFSRARKRRPAGVWQHRAAGARGRSSSRARAGGPLAERLPSCSWARAVTGFLLMVLSRRELAMLGEKGAAFDLVRLFRARTPISDRDPRTALWEGG